MGVQSPEREQTGISDLLAIGFGTTVAMWAVAYFGHMPLLKVPTAVFVSLMLVCLTAGGWVVGRNTPRGIRGGLGVGLVAGLLNLLILSSALAKPDTGQLVPQAWLWVPGYFLLCLALAAGGAALGASSRQAGTPPVNWLSLFAWVACVAMLLLISIGGLVTGFRAGMAVPDWPNTYGSNMFLYPLAKMTGGVFYEHAHRLLGSLVGLTTLTLAILLSIIRRSTVALVLIWTVGLCVAIQGIMGGLRVTDNSTHLAVIHGFFAHLILAGMVGVAVLLARRPQPEQGSATSNPTDCILSAVLLLAILMQTLLGTLVRQMDWGLMIHISAAMLVAMLAMLVGVRLWGLHPQVTVFSRGGVALMGVVVVQILLGGISLVFRTPPAGTSPSAEQLQIHAAGLRPVGAAIITTVHQTTAAVLLGIAALLAFWTWRLLVLQEEATTTAQQPPSDAQGMTAAS